MVTVIRCHLRKSYKISHEEGFQNDNRTLLTRQAEVELAGEIAQQRISRRNILLSNRRLRGCHLGFNGRRLVVGVLTRVEIEELSIGEESQVLGEVLICDVRLLNHRLLDVEVAQIVRDVDSPVRHFGECLPLKFPRGSV